MKRSLITVAAAAVLLFATCGGAAAQGIEKGQIEFSFSLGYFDLDVGNVNASAWLVLGQAAYAVTDRLEVGGLGGYVNLDGTLDDENGTISAWMIGPVVQFNFMPKQKWTPFVGASYAILHGSAEAGKQDTGNLLDSRWSLDAGIKYYPVEHVGIVTAVSYGKIAIEEGNLDFTDPEDITLWMVSSGISLRF